ncbi:MAG: CAP domain-containing protein [Spirochaetota bacterium]|jgi:uncharacterized protein YkwD|nr:CAP domain-containing protein [Spirochaetota bacterium]
MKRTLCIALSICAFLITACFTPGQRTAGSKNTAQTGTQKPGSVYQTNPNTQPGQAANTAGRADPDAKNWDIKKLDTAADAAYLAAIEKDVILEMNKVRSDPAKYSDLYIKPRAQYYKGKTYAPPGQIALLTDEGASAVNECANALRKSKSVGLLSPEKGLSLAAQAHAADQGRTGQIGHTGSDRSTTDARMKRYGSFSGSWTYGENIDYGSKTAREILASLLIDDGVSDRGHRKNIMHKDFTQTGAGFGAHTRYGAMCTITFARGYKSN